MTFYVIQRGDRTGIRLYDPNCEGRKSFKGLEWYAVDPAYRIEAKFVPYEKPKMLPILNVIGDTRTVRQYILSPITRLSETALREQ